MAEGDVEFVRLKTSTGDIVQVEAEFGRTLVGHGYKPVGASSRRRADTGTVPAQPAAPARAGREPEPTTAQLEQQLQSRRSRSTDQH